MEERLDEQVKSNVKLQTRLNESAKKVIVNNISEGLVDTQKDKLATLAEGVDFVSEEEYTKKVKALKESYFPNAPVVREENEETPVEDAAVSPAMAAYINAMARWSE